MKPSRARARVRVRERARVRMGIATPEGDVYQMERWEYLEAVRCGAGRVQKKRRKIGQGEEAQNRKRRREPSLLVPQRLGRCLGRSDTLAHY